MSWTKYFEQNVLFVMMENTFGNHRENKNIWFFSKIPKIILRHDKRYFSFKICLISLQKTLEMNELAPNKQTLKIPIHSSQKQKS